MKKLFFSLLIFLLPASAAFSQNDGIDYFLLGNLEGAKDFFQNNRSGNAAESNYYLGEIAYAEGDMAAAKSYYEKGLAASADYVMNSIGLARLTWQNNPAEGKAKLLDIAKANRKNADALVAIARAFHENGMNEEALRIADDAAKADKDSPALLMLRSDMFIASKEYGKATSLLEQTIMKDKNNPVPYLKLADIYSRINPTISIQKLNDLLQVRAGYVPAQKALALAYYNQGRYNQVISIYQDLTSSGVNLSLEDLTNYAAALFFTERFDEAAPLIAEGLARDPNNFIFNRLRMYSAFETQNWQNGLRYAQDFFAIPDKDSSYIARDFLTYGDFLLNTGDMDNAAKQYEKAIANSEKNDNNENDNLIYKTISDKFNKAGQTEKATEYLEKYIDKVGDQAEVADFYTWGTMLYKAANAALKDTLNPDSRARAEVYLHKADRAFSVVMDRLPDNQLGFLFRARVNSLLDPEGTSELARPYYQKALEIIQAKDDPSSYKREQTEIYTYMAYIEFTRYEAGKSNADKERAIEYSKKVLELDPSNATATNIIDYLNQ